MKMSAEAYIIRFIGDLLRARRRQKAYRALGIGGKPIEKEQEKQAPIIKEAPFRSTAQRKWMYANHPEMAKHWEAVTPKSRKLPEHVKKTAALYILIREAMIRGLEKLGGSGPVSVTDERGNILNLFPDVGPTIEDLNVSRTSKLIEETRRKRRQREREQETKRRDEDERTTNTGYASPPVKQEWAPYVFEGGQ